MVIMGAGLFGSAALLVGLAPSFTAATIALAVAASILTLRYPWLPWLPLCLVIPFSATARLAGLSMADLILAAAVVMWSAAAVARREWRVAVTVPVWPVLLYAFILLAATLRAGDLAEAVAEVIKWLQVAVILLVGPNALPRRSAPWLVALLLAAAAGQAIFGLYQFIFGIGPEWFVIQERFVRAYGTFRQPNPFAGYLGVTLPVAVSLLLWSFIDAVHAQNRLLAVGRTALLAAITALITAGLLASWSRGAWMGMLLAVALVVTLSHRMGALAMLMTAGATLVAALLGSLSPTLVPAAIRARLADIPAYFGGDDILRQPVTDANFAVLERLAHWVAALRMWANSPWLGVGPGNYNSAYTTVALPQWPHPLGHAHNIYLNVLAESGVLGIVAFAILWLSLAYWTIRRRNTANRVDWRYALAVGALGVYCHLAVHSVFDNLFVQGIYLHIALWPAILALAWKDGD